MTQLVLASASPARRRLLVDAGFAPEVVVSGVHEDDVEGTPAEIAGILAARKAEAVVARLGAADALVVGCDSVLDVDGAPRGKPTDADEFRRWWRTVAGRDAVLHTGHHVIDVGSGRRAGAVASTVVRFGRPTATELAAYWASGEPAQVAGGCTIDGRGAPFIDGIVGDAGTVIGLSLPTLRRLVHEVGRELTDLWVP